MREYNTGYTPLVTELTQDLGRLSAATVYPLPDLTDRVRHDGLYTYIENLEPGLYIDPAVVLPRQSALPFHFSLRPGRRLTHENSRHKVYFGDFLHQVGETAVAVKTMPEHDLGELAITQLFEQEGIPTFRPLGYLISNEKKSEGLARGHMLMVYQPGIEPIASIDWRELSDEEKWNYAGYAADTMALVHPHMFFHFDLHFRNVVIDKVGNVLVPDLEHTVSMRTAASAVLLRPDAAKSDVFRNSIKSCLNEELDKVSESTEEFVFSSLRPRIKDPLVKFNKIRTHLYDRYEEQIKASNTEYTQLLHQIYLNVLTERKEDARRDKL